MIGIPLTEVEKNLDEEMKNFRMKLFDSCEKAEKERGIEGTLHYAFPEERIIKSAFERSSLRSKSK